MTIMISQENEGKMNSVKAIDIELVIVLSWSSIQM